MIKIFFFFILYCSDRLLNDVIIIQNLTYFLGRPLPFFSSFWKCFVFLWLERAGADKYDLEQISHTYFLPTGSFLDLLCLFSFLSDGFPSPSWGGMFRVGSCTGIFCMGRGIFCCTKNVLKSYNKIWYEVLFEEQMIDLIWNWKRFAEVMVLPLINIIYCFLLFI